MLSNRALALDAGHDLSHQPTQHSSYSRWPISTGRWLAGIEGCRDGALAEVSRECWERGAPVKWRTRAAPHLVVHAAPHPRHRQDELFRVQGLGFGGFGFKVEDVGLRIEGCGFGV